MIKKLIFEIEIDKARELIEEIDEHIEVDSTTVVFELECTQDKQDRNYNVVRFKVRYGGTRA